MAYLSFLHGTTNNQSRHNNYCSMCFNTYTHCIIRHCFYSTYVYQHFPPPWLYIRVEWFSTFCVFRKATRFCGSGIFLRGRFKKNPFRKNRWDLKNQYFFVENFRILPFTSKNNRQEEISNLKVVYYFFYSQKWSNGFLICTGGK